MPTETTYTGICQACGRRQAIHVKSGLIAKHGYTTDWGFFNGTCQGSDHAPLELQTVLNEDITRQLRIRADALALEAAVGEITKVSVKVGSKYVGGRRVDEFKLVDRAEFEATQPRYEKFDREVELLRARLRRQAEAFRSHAADLERLRAEVHGQPLQERPQEAPIQREYFGSYREAYARVEELKAAGHKAQQRREKWGRQFVVTYR